MFIDILRFRYAADTLMLLYAPRFFASGDLRFAADRRRH